MVRLLIAVAALAACGRSQGVPDRELGDLVIAPKTNADPIDLSRAKKDPAELGRALRLPEHAVAAALGPHTVSISTATTVDEAGKRVQELTDHVTIELGDKGAWHAIYANSADYGRETIFIPASGGDKLYLRPRYQRWHERAPETPDEPQQLRDGYYEAIAATWDLVAPAAELTDLGPASVAGRAGEKIRLELSPRPNKPPAEPLQQRKWREKRSIDALTGEVVLDAEKGVPLAVRLTGSIGFSRDGRRFSMNLSLDASIAGIGQVAQVAAPGADDVVATPERLREVDDRDFLLQGIAPPLRKNADGTAVAPAPKEKP
ncbi:MAG: hypothetical protein ACM31C_15130 [Acidobacteriota bacterium]